MTVRNRAEKARLIGLFAAHVKAHMAVREKIRRECAAKLEAGDPDVVQLLAANALFMLEAKIALDILLNAPEEVCRFFLEHPDKRQQLVGNVLIEFESLPIN